MSTGHYSGAEAQLYHQFPVDQQLAAKVEALLEKYRRVTTLHPSLEQFSKTPEYFSLFSKVFNHHVRLIKSRPQELERGYVTVFDRALMRLTAGGRDMYHKGGIALFLEEILGVRTADRVEDLEIILKGNIALRSALLETVETEKKSKVPIPRTVEPEKESPHLQASREPEFDRQQKDNATNSAKDSINRLLLTFANAQYEYCTMNDRDSNRRRHAAKFLRDSAENALTYLRTSQPDHYMIPNLKRAFDMAQEKSIGLNGGRKRPFEMSDEEYSRRTKRNMEYRHGRGDCYRPGNSNC